VNLAASQHVLGPDHPRTLTTRNNFAVHLLRTGNTDEAIELLSQAKRDVQRLLDAASPAILTACRNLATALEQAGRRDDAITELKHALNDYEPVHGPCAPGILAARSLLNRLTADVRDSGR
jgi:tetratricopeptide (TPR) repeat protein